MPHSNGIIYVDRTVTPHIGVGFVEDIAHVLGYDSGEIGRLVTEGNINPMALHKPVRINSRDELTYAQLKGTRFGMAAPPSFSPVNSNYPQAWQYLRPRGVDNNYQEPFRPLDFDKYDTYAAQPVVMEMPGGLVLGGAFPIMLWADAYVNVYYANRPLTIKRWRDGYSIPIQDVLEGGQGDYSGYYIGFVFFDLTTGDATLVATNKTFSTLQSSSALMFYPQGDGTASHGDFIKDGIHYPYIPLLDDINRDGHNFRVVVCLAGAGPSDPTTYAYQVLQNDYTCYSLGFDSRRRTDMVVTVAKNHTGVHELSGELNAGLSLVKVGDYDATWEAWLPSADFTAAIDTGASWDNTHCNVRVKVVSPSGLIGLTPYDAGITGEDIHTVDVSLPDPGTTYQNKNLGTVSGYIFFPKTAGAADKRIIVSAEFVQGSNVNPFTNILQIYSL